jgi:coenzyme PQQ precursor peptide PqqA
LSREIYFSLLLFLMTKGVIVWKKPQITEIAIGLEINSYACAVK